MTVNEFLKRWKKSGGSEQANAQLFLTELCDILEVPRPDPAREINEENIYSFERKVPVSYPEKSLKRLDLYRRGAFVLESKQGRQGQSEAMSLLGETSSKATRRGGKDWERLMLAARNQADGYIRALPPGEGRPPFLIVADIGYCFDLYSEFSRSGGVYLPFPDPASWRVYLDDLAKPEVRELLRSVWLDPMSLDPSRKALEVTEDIAAKLGELAKSLEEAGNAPEESAHFLMRCLFTMFACDMNLIPRETFRNIIKRSLQNPAAWESSLQDLWRAMNDGSFSISANDKLLRFNGNLFAYVKVLKLSRPQMALLLEAAKADWRHVEPAIFGTLLERALDSRERHKLGAHYTPRAYVERLVSPTLILPLRREWENAQAEAALREGRGDEAGALAALEAFYDSLLKLRVLDPACGSGNFLYIAMEQLKRLEGEVVNALKNYPGHKPRLRQISPEQFLGLEVNPRAAAIAEMALWIGYLQWHERAAGHVSPPEPVLGKSHNIECRDAVLAWKKEKYATGPDGRPTTRWDGHTVKIDAATGLEVPDESARIPDLVYEGATPAEWPQADFIIGNPPFVGNKRMRLTLGDGYVNALRSAYPDMPESCDFVMYWWRNAAELAKNGKIRAFGFVTTNSITQIYNRKILAHYLDAKTDPLGLVFAIPDHPWVDAADGAAVRIAMTAAAKGAKEGTLVNVIAEESRGEREVAVELEAKKGQIHPDLTIGVNAAAAKPLKANEDMSLRGMTLLGKGFLLKKDELESMGWGKRPGIEERVIPYASGQELGKTRPRGLYAIDLFGLTDKEVLENFPELYQRVFQTVKPDRDARASRNNDAAIYAKYWWLYAKPRPTLRQAKAGLLRLIATVTTAKHRLFQFIEQPLLPDSSLTIFPSEDAYFLGLLSSHIHIVWALAQGGTLEDRPTYNNSRCFATFPFPDASEAQKEKIRELGERLDKFRKERLAEHDNLTMTSIYNALEAYRATIGGGGNPRQQ